MLMLALPASSLDLLGLVDSLRRWTLGATRLASLGVDLLRLLVRRAALRLGLLVLGLSVRPVPLKKIGTRLLGFRVCRPCQCQCHGVLPLRT